MKVFFDMEFTGLHQNTTPLSIGCVSESGKTFYAEFNDYDKKQLDSWLRKNVMKNMLFDDSFFAREHQGSMEIKNTSRLVKESLTMWLKSFDEEIEMWSDCLSYDWVLLCELFGGALKIPSCIYYIPFDICSLFKAEGVDPDINRETYANMEVGSQKHNALWDAKVIKACYDILVDSGSKTIF